MQSSLKDELLIPDKRSFVRLQPELGQVVPIEDQCSYGCHQEREPTSETSLLRCTCRPVRYAFPQRAISLPDMHRYVRVRFGRSRDPSVELSRVEDGMSRSCGQFKIPLRYSFDYKSLSFYSLFIFFFFISLSLSLSLSLSFYLFFLFLLSFPLSFLLSFF
ncbi:unnamed protein product [Acanthosepion pharaonis]|uniref:Uncharacterized protein n=1 Tax=Acanthosepion pharaonis TaxID=158019 RepID=A0A812C6I9_ACAPH|nr:unnamed protein product [Sepia pharaonis]